ncbi:MAG TPA: sialidase family protein [Methylomirabilota bacterium]|nr:sialidase family protein [Methylomirabilota bacterium]
MRHIIYLLACALIPLLSSVSGAAVRLERVPEEGIQPQVEVDSKGRVHLLYFKGDPKAGDIFYTHRQQGAGATWAASLKVNSHQKATALGNVRGAHLAIGAGGRPHVAWMGSGMTSSPAGEQHPMLYTRLAEDGKRFEPERNLITHGYGLDGGGSLAADAKGNVFVAWHANGSSTEKSETNRVVYLARSTDGGKTFGREVAVSPAGKGACACCGMKISHGPGDLVSILYRNAASTDSRAATLLVSIDGGKTFTEAGSEPWSINACPMSTAYLGRTEKALLAGWETAGKVKFAGYSPDRGEFVKTFTPEGQKKARFPTAAHNSSRETLLVWTEGMAWMKGGSVAWMVVNERGEPVGERGHKDGVPVWSFVAAYPEGSDAFVIVY